MLKRLQAKWKVKGWDLLLIICTFAIGGSLCGYLGRRILLLTSLEKNVGWVLLYILLISLLWPLCVLLVSLPLGQFSFFKKYIEKMLVRMKLKRQLASEATYSNIVIFASGAGSNAQKIIEHFKQNPAVKIKLVVSNRSSAGVLDIARKYHIETMLVGKELPLGGDLFIKELKQRNTDLIVLAGFLLKIPVALITAFPKKIINIHPALLPAYGGKGMYGIHVHEAVILNKEIQSGITIHYVDEIYDHGEILFQTTCNIDAADTAEMLAKKIHALEHEHYPLVIESLLKK